MLGGPFTTPDILDSGATGSLVNLVQAKDRFNRIHLIWAHQYTDGSAAILYTRWENGVYSILRLQSQWPPRHRAPRRNTGIAVGPGGRVYVRWGRDGESLFYSFTDTGVVWAVTSSLPWVAGAADLAIGVSTGGQVFVAWCNPVGPGRTGNRWWPSWRPGPTLATDRYLQPRAAQRRRPSSIMAADNAAGMRFVWDEAPQELIRRSMISTARMTSGNGVQ